MNKLFSRETDDEKLLLSSRIDWRVFNTKIANSERLMLRYITQTCLGDKNMHKALSSLKEVFLLTRGNLYLSLFHELETQEMFNKRFQPFYEKSNFKLQAVGRDSWIPFTRLNNFRDHILNLNRFQNATSKQRTN